MPLVEREALARQAIDAARRSCDLTALAEVLTETHIALWGPDTSHERLEMAREAVRLAQVTGQPFYEAGATPQGERPAAVIHGPSGPPRNLQEENRFRRHGEYWTIAYGGSNHPAQAQSRVDASRGAAARAGAGDGSDRTGAARGA